VDRKYRVEGEGVERDEGYVEFWERRVRERLVILDLKRQKMR